MNNCIYNEMNRTTVRHGSAEYTDVRISTRRRNDTAVNNNEGIAGIIIEMMISLCCSVIAFFERPTVNEAVRRTVVVLRIAAGICACAAFFVFVNTVAAGNGQYRLALGSALISVAISFIAFRV
ncbi:MAG: hypothetical protein MJ102_04145 [Clostridia bacterium]|nr:hypothetical protein [Clostridia bacterium]